MTQQSSPWPAARAATPAWGAALALLLLAGCETVGGDPGATNTRTGAWWICPPTKNAAGAEHGKPCKIGSDCAYGHCVAGSFLAGYDGAIRFCTKNNACDSVGSSETAPCSVDDAGGLAFTPAFEKSKSGGNARRISAEPAKVCALSCASDAACEAWNPEMPHCIKSSTTYVSVGAVGACGKDPTR